MDSASALRRCVGCDIEHPIEAFAYKNRARGVRHSRCKAWTRVVSKEHYVHARDTYIARNRRNTPRLRFEAARLVYTYLQTHPCVLCGEADPVVLEFDHLDPASKLADVAELIAAPASPKRIFVEIDRCRVLCANCHQRHTTLGRAVHWKLPATVDWLRTTPGFRAAADRRNKGLLLDYLSQRACVDCGQTDPLVLQLDHRGDKTADMATLVASGCNRQRIVDELAKCEVRCANCHRRRTAEAGDWKRVRLRRGGPGDSADNP